MKRIALLSAVASVAFSTGAKAQLTMQMSNGWNFTFAGNVNAFGIYTSGSIDRAGTITGGLVPEEKVTRVRTGLLPAFATFEAKGHEAGLDLAVHFGFAPQINSDGQHDNFGAQIDMRQVYLTAGGSWGQILAGREIGLYQRQNILNDATLFGAGPTGGGVGAKGTTLGRIGFGYIYPNFNAQLTYSTPASSPVALSIGLFDPSIINSSGATTFKVTKTPRIEAELSYTLPFGSAGADGKPANKVLLWVSGAYQHADSGIDTGPSVDAEGGAAGARVDIAGLGLVGSGYYARGFGTTLMFSAPAVDSTGKERDSYGYILQATFAVPATSFTLGGSWGESRMMETDADKAIVGDPLVLANSALIVFVNYQLTKSLKWVFEGTYAQARAFSGAKTKSYQGTTGLMLFF
jgi:hypothetical protein